MSLPDNAEELQELFYRAGFDAVDAPYDTSEFTEPESVQQCSIIARNGNFVIIYAEATSNWRQIAVNLLRKAREMCLIAMHAGQGHYVFSTLTIANGASKPVHVVINSQTRQQMVRDFVSGMRIPPDIIDIRIPMIVEKAFAKFDLYANAIDEFAENLEAAIRATRAAIEKSSKNNKAYNTESARFLSMCREVISDRLEPDDIPEMLLQHILTYRIFGLIYGEHDLHNINAVARSLEGLIRTLDINAVEMRARYKTIELVAELITDASEKQNLLKQIYETFYEKYDPENADKWGIVYTPSEIVDFMVRSTEQLLNRHFKSGLSDDGVTILDPATGTGTFVTSILRHLKPSAVEAKYKKDIFANEVSILAYYIAALNIENTYHSLTGKAQEFENICWMDTLDSGVKNYEKMTSYFDDDNIKRMSRQQKTEIQVVIGNPPYNAVQTSFNNANPADKYPHIDEKIQKDYSGFSNTFTKSKSLDMYKRFLKWSSNRIKGNGMVVFVSNNAFLDAKADDGTRKALYEEFDYIYAVNLKGNTRLSGAWRREGGKVFGQRARVGIVITFFIKTGENQSMIRYAEVKDYMNRESKLKWLKKHTISTLKLKKIVPDGDAFWLNQTNNDFDKLPPVLPKKYQESIFEISTPGVTTAKDEWVYSFDKSKLGKKMKFYVSVYNDMLAKYKTKNINPKELDTWVSKKIKWSDKTIQDLGRERSVTYSNNKITTALYRPFVVKYLYYDKTVIHRTSEFPNIFKNSQKNFLIAFSNPITNHMFSSIGTDIIVEFGMFGGSQTIPIWKYDNSGKKSSNVTQYGLDLFRSHYKNKKINGDDIFYYTYAIFNDPKYEQEYKFNLQRNFPHIPLAKNFERWSDIGRKLFDLHRNFNNSKEYGLKQIDKNVWNDKPRLQLKIERIGKDTNIKIVIDDSATLEGIPEESLEYTIGSKTPIEWILEFYRESKNQISDKSSDDEGARKRFNTYKFSAHKEELITLLNRVTTVCVETVKLKKELGEMEWGRQPKLRPSEMEVPRTSKKRTAKTKKLKKARLNMPQDTIDGLGQKRLL